MQLMDVPAAVTDLIGQPQYEEEGGFPVEHGYIWNTCAATENANPLFWDDDVASTLTAGSIAPPTMLSVWFRPHHWSPGRSEPAVPLQGHFDLKELLELPEAIISENTITFHTPVRIGDRIRSRQVLRSISEPKTTRLGTGRFWVLEVEYLNRADELIGVESYTAFGYRRPDPPDAGESANDQSSRGGGSGGSESAGSQSAATTDDDSETGLSETSSSPASISSHRLLLSEVSVGDELTPLNKEVSATTVVLGALASRDWRPMHHDYDFAVNRNGTRDIFLNTPNQAAWFERFITDWTGPTGRLGRMTFRMRDSVYPHETMTFTAEVTGTKIDEIGCGWAELDVTLTAGGRIATLCHVRVALPTDDDDNPWARVGNQWKP